MLARMLDGYRDYFHWVAEAHLKPADGVSPELQRARLSGRLARSNLEASIARLRAEPFTPAGRLLVLDAILANSHRFIRAAMSLESALAFSRAAPADEAFRTFAHDVERTLEILAGAVRASDNRRMGLPHMALPDLRQDCQALITSSGAENLFAVETDRITNSLNTLAGEIARWSGH
jgi:hypothetical protein